MSRSAQWRKYSMEMDLRRLVLTLSHPEHARHAACGFLSQHRDKPETASLPCMQGKAVVPPTQANVVAGTKDAIQRLNPTLFLLFFLSKLARLTIQTERV